VLFCFCCNYDRRKKEISWKSYGAKYIWLVVAGWIGQQNTVLYIKVAVNIKNCYYFASWNHYEVLLLPQAMLAKQSNGPRIKFGNGRYHTLESKWEVRLLTPGTPLCESSLRVTSQTLTLEELNICMPYFTPMNQSVSRGKQRIGFTFETNFEPFFLCTIYKSNRKLMKLLSFQHSMAKFRNKLLIYKNTKNSNSFLVWKPPQKHIYLGVLLGSTPIAWCMVGYNIKSYEQGLALKLRALRSAKIVLILNPLIRDSFSTCSRSLLNYN